MSDRCVAHLDMDAFYVSVELRRHPELRGLPLIVAGRGPRAVVTTASYEARRFGVGSAMPAARALRLCPQATVLPPDFPYYRAASAEVMAIVRSHVERVEVIGLDEAYLELTGLPAQPDDTAAARSGSRTTRARPEQARPDAKRTAGSREWLAGGEAVASMRRIRTEIERATGLSCSVGIGPSKLVAKVASDAEKPRGFVILGREQACARFAESPCSLIPGIGPKTAERLRSLGITTLGQLRDARPADLAARFGGRYAAELQRRAAFLDDAPVTEERKVVSESRETTFDRDISDPAELEAVLAGLVQKLCAALADQGRAGRTIGIKVRLDDFSTHTRARTLPEPVYTAERVGPVALELLRRFAAPRPVRLVGVRVAGLEQRIAGDAVAERQLSLAV